MLLPMSTPTATRHEEALKAMTAETLASLFARGQRVQEFWNANYIPLRELYPEQFVAVDIETGKVVAVNRHIFRLADELRERGIDIRNDVAVEFLTHASASLIL